MNPDNLQQATDTDFAEKVLNNPLPVLVDFWATWCGPCRAVAPKVEEIARENAGRLAVVKVDVDRARKVANDYNVRSIPTLLVFRNGQVMGQLVGNQPKSRIQELVSRVL